MSGITEEGQVEVKVGRDGFPVDGGLKTVRVHRGAQEVSFVSLEADSAQNMNTTTALTLTFDKPINGLAGNEIDILPLNTANDGVTIQPPRGQKGKNKGLGRL